MDTVIGNGGTHCDLLINSSPAMVPLTAPLFWVLF